MAGWHTCSHGWCSDCGYGGFEHHPECDARVFTQEEIGEPCVKCAGLAAPKKETTVLKKTGAASKRRAPLKGGKRAASLELGAIVRDITVYLKSIRD